MTRAEHLEWAKRRALEYFEPGQFYSLASAMASMISDLRKHPELERHPGIELGMALGVGGHLSNERAVRKWIEGFN